MVPMSTLTMYTLAEAAAISRRTDKAMYQLRSRGLGPRFRKVDGRLLVSAEDLNRWLLGDEAAASA